jgi:predicted metal-dependent enzyme (double-stranded beta helix superfamily)
MSISGYGIADLIEDLDRIVATEKDPRMLIGRASEDLRKLMINRGSIPDTFLKATNPSGTTRNLIHKHPQDRYVILAIIWSPGYVTPIHDHGIWGVSGVYENVLRVTNYVRLDDGSRPDYAELNEHSSILAGVGSVTYVLPPNEEIHQIDIPSSDRAVSIHVYGRDIRTCSYYDPKTRKVGQLDLTYHNIL